MKIHKLLFLLLLVSCNSKEITNSVNIDKNKSIELDEKQSKAWRNFEEKHGQDRGSGEKSNEVNPTGMSEEEMNLIRIPMPHWYLAIYEMSMSPEWKALVEEVKSNDSTRNMLLQKFLESEANYEDIHFSIYHTIPCVLYEARGGNLEGVLAHYSGVRFRENRVLKLLLYSDVDETDYSDKINFDSTEEGIEELNKRHKGSGIIFQPISPE